MGFRGVLLALREREAGAFRVVSADAWLQLPTSGVLREAPYTVEQKVLVTDYVTSELQQVTRLSSVTIQRETRSALWTAMAPAKISPDDARASAYAFTDPASLVRQVCYCFFFRAQIEFDLFETAHTAARRLLKYSLLEKSVKMELAIQRDLDLNPRMKTKPPPTSDVPVPLGHEELKRRREHLRKQLQERTTEKQVQQQAQAIREQAAELEAERLKAAAAEAKRAKDKSRASTPVAQAVTGVSAPLEECILCGTDSTYRRFAGTFVNHPYVLKDGRGAAVMICKICLQRVLKQRVTNDRSRGDSFVDELCGLCAEPIADAKGDTKMCSHPQCPRVYCSPCLKKLFGKAQVQKVWRTKRWNCTNCTPTNENGKPEDEPTDPDSKKRKREYETSNGKAHHEITPGVVELPAPVIDVDTVIARDDETGKPMTLLDYACNYYEFLVGREEQDAPLEDSEDVCFCCKDGGDVLECDWEGCPKVYHQDCLGYTVKENIEWICPRHRCYKCGFAGQFACRFCVTSFCKGHLPENAKMLGPATEEINEMTYVMCPACDDMMVKGIDRAKISRKLHDRMLHPPGSRKQRSKQKQKKRVR